MEGEMTDRQENQPHAPQRRTLSLSNIETSKEDLWELSGKWEPPESCPLTSTHVSWHLNSHTHMHTHTFTHTQVCFLNKGEATRRENSQLDGKVQGDSVALGLGRGLLSYPPWHRWRSPRETHALPLATRLWKQWTPRKWLQESHAGKRGRLTSEEKFVPLEVHTVVTTCQTKWSKDSCGRDLTRTVPMPAFCHLFKLKLVSEPQRWTWKGHWTSLSHPVRTH